MAPCDECFSLAVADSLLKVAEISLRKRKEKGAAEVECDELAPQKARQEYVIAGNEAPETDNEWPCDTHHQQKAQYRG